MTARVPVFVPEAEAAPFTFIQDMLEVAVQVRVPVPALVIVTDWLAGAAPFCTAEKESAGGVSPIVGVGVGGGGGGVSADGVGATNCASPGISAATLLIDRPPVLPLPEVEELPAPAAASGMVLVDAVPAAMDPVAVTGDGRTLKGTVAPTLLWSEEGSLG